MTGRITLVYPTESDKDRFLKAMQDSVKLHSPWLKAPLTESEFQGYLKKYKRDNNLSYLVSLGESLVGVININEIVRGCFQSGYLGFYAVEGFSGKGYMSQGLGLVIQAAFSEHGLHRLEANIQPDNSQSIALVKRHHFMKEGFSPAYLKLNGEWRDHERWALLEDKRI